MINIYDLLFEVCEDERVYEPDFNLVESEVFDSLAFIEFFTLLEDYGFELQPTRIDRKRLVTPESIEKLINELIYDKTSGSNN